MPTTVKCPVCDRLIALSAIAKNIKGESIMVWHLAEDIWFPGGLAAYSHECSGSYKSLSDATKEYEHILFLQHHPQAENINHPCGDNCQTCKPKNSDFFDGM